MAPRFDDEERSIELSVADLLERDALGSLGFANRGGFERLWLGQAVHSRYQESALADDPSYRTEVTLRHTFVHRGWNVSVKGRADGVRRDGDGLTRIEEIKSLRPGHAPSTATLEAYRRQALLYAWILSQQLDEPVGVELVLITIGSSSVERELLELDTSVIDALVKRRLNALIREHESERQTQARKQQAAETLAFPFHRPRPGQDRILDEVSRALEQGEHLLVEAPTGLGKTAASLFPVLRYALTHRKRIFVLTAKTLQQEMATEVLDLLNTRGEFRTLRLRAKARMCANEELLCHEDYCRFARDFYAKLNATRLIEALVDEHPTLLPDSIFDAARRESVCPFEVSLEVGQRADVVVCDYNYAFDPYVSLTEFGAQEDLSDTLLVIDEIHNLVDRGRGYYSPTLSAQRCRQVAREYSHVDGLSLGSRATSAAIEERLSSLSLELSQVIAATVQEGLPLGTDSSVEASLPEEELWTLRPELDRAFADYLEHRRQTKSFRAEDPFVGLYFDFLRFLNTLEISHRDEFSHLIESQEGDQRLRILCKDPSHLLGALLNRCHSAIGLSATLSPPDFYRDLLGFDSQRTSHLKVESPFPKTNRRIVIDSSVTTTYKQRPQNYQPIADRLGALSQAVPGNCLALFPSYHFLTEVVTRLEGIDKRVLIQDRANGEKERQEILDSLRSGALFGDVFLFAVAGGVFAEGVDYPGDMLKAVAIVGPCLPGLTLEQKLLESYYDERFERGFEYAFVVPGMTRVVQAAGRLIRSATDTGVVALLDRRFLRSPYREHLPTDWLDEGEARSLVGDAAGAARAFFEPSPRSLF